jgi:hypothetical protein
VYFRLWEKKPEPREQQRRYEMKEKIIDKWKDRLAGKVEHIDDSIIDISVDQSSIKVSRSRPSTSKGKIQVGPAKRGKITSKIMKGASDLENNYQTSAIKRIAIKMVD